MAQNWSIGPSIEEEEDEKNGGQEENLIETGGNQDQDRIMVVQCPYNIDELNKGKQSCIRE